MNTTNKPAQPWLNSYDDEVNQHLSYPKLALHDLLDQSVNHHPNSTALIFRDKKIDYKDLWEYVCNFASGLVDLGIKKGDRVGLAVVNSPTFVIAFYGILKAGGVVVAINPIYKGSEFTFILDNSQIEAVICQDENFQLINGLQLVKKLRVVIKSSINLDAERLALHKSSNGTSTLGDDQNHEEIYFINLALRKSERAVFPAIDPEKDAAVFQYSGGTTGTPKAAIGLHRNLVANSTQFRKWLWSLKDGSETVLAAIPLYHVYGMVIALNVGVMMGAALLIEDDLRDLDRLLGDVEKYQPGLFPCVPNLYSGILQKVRSSERKFDLTSLRICISGSAPLLPAVKEEFERLTVGKVLEGYGLSEAPTATHCNPLAGVNKTGSIGMPLPDVDCKIIPLKSAGNLDTDTSTGELLIRGPQVMAGYFNAGVDDSDILAEGWLHTGDIASMDSEGYFYIQGRKKDLIKVGGFQVWPTEIEEIISKHPAVKEVCVAGVPGGEKREIVKAWVVRKEGAQVSEVDIREWVHERLVGYKVPGLVDFRENLPRTPVGKVLRRELIREYLEQMGNSTGNPIKK